MPTYNEDARRQKIIAPDGTEIFSEVPVMTAESGPFEGMRSAATDEAFVTVSSMFLEKDTIPPTFRAETNRRYIDTKECGLTNYWLLLNTREHDGQHKGWASELKLSVSERDIPALREHLQERLRYLKTITPVVNTDKNLKALSTSGKILYLDQDQHK